jgi:hypothetical protein
MKEYAPELGLLHISPIQTCEKTNNKDYIRFYLYRIKNQYFCAFQVCINNKPFSCSLKANSPLFASEFSAKESAVKSITKWAKQNHLTKRLVCLYPAEIYQLELF